MAHTNLKRKMTSLIEKIGAEKLKEENFRGYTHVLKIYIGDLYLRVDTGGPVASVLGNFLDNVQEAKKELGHWKYNLHVDKKEDEESILSKVEIHINYVK